MNTTARTIITTVATALALTACAAPNDAPVPAPSPTTQAAPTTATDGPPDDYTGTTLEDAQQHVRGKWAKANTDELMTMTQQFEDITGESITPGDALKVTFTICGAHNMDTDIGTNAVQEFRDHLTGTIDKATANKIVDTALTYCDSL